MLNLRGLSEFWVLCRAGRQVLQFFELEYEHPVLDCHSADCLQGIWLIWPGQKRS